MTKQPPAGWRLEGKALVREFEFKDFLAALDFVNAVGTQAEAIQHHPDILLHNYRKVKITTSTHDVGGLTENDFELAERINKLGIN